MQSKVYFGKPTLIGCNLNKCTMILFISIYFFFVLVVFFNTVSLFYFFSFLNLKIMDRFKTLWITQSYCFKIFPYLLNLYQALILLSSYHELNFKDDDWEALNSLFVSHSYLLEWHLITLTKQDWNKFYLKMKLMENIVPNCT